SYVNRSPNEKPSVFNEGLLVKIQLTHPNRLHLRLGRGVAWAADAVVDEAVFFHGFGAVEVSAVEDDGAVHQFADLVEVGVAELVPVGADDQAVGAFEG